MTTPLSKRMSKLEGADQTAPPREIALLGPIDPDLPDWPDRTSRCPVRSIRLVGVSPWRTHDEAA